MNLSSSAAADLNSYTACIEIARTDRRESTLRFKSIACSILLLFLGGCESPVEDSVEVDSSFDTYLEIEIFDELILESLGISLPALSRLARWSPGSYSRLDYLESSGEIKFVRELEAKGFIDVQTKNGRPEDGEADVAFIRIQPIGKGIEIVAGMILLKQEVYGIEASKTKELIDHLTGE